MLAFPWRRFYSLLNTLIKCSKLPHTDQTIKINETEVDLWLKIIKMYQLTVSRYQGLQGRSRTRLVL